jgi:uncharacterized membrane protein YjjB (DUF3815 family)
LAGFLAIGRTLVYCLDYGIPPYIPAGTKQWRVPAVIQLIPGGLIFTGLFFLKVTPRWLKSKDSYEEALQYLAYIRNKPYGPRGSRERDS